MSVYYNIWNTLPKSGAFLLGHPVFIGVCGGVRTWKCTFWLQNESMTFKDPAA